MVDVCSSWNMEAIHDGEEHLAWGDWAGLDDINHVEPWDADNGAKQKLGNVDGDVVERRDSNSATTHSSNLSTSGEQNSSHQTMNAHAHHTGKLFVGGLPNTCSKEDLRDYFSQFGPILDCVVMFDKDSRHRGFGFVTFKEASDKDAVMAMYDQHYIKHKWVEVKQCIPKHDMDLAHTAHGNYNNYLGNNSTECTMKLPQEQSHRNVKNPVKKFSTKTDVPNMQTNTSDDSHLPMPQRLERVSQKTDMALYETDVLQNRAVGNIFTDISELRSMQDKLAKKIHLLRNKTRYGVRLDEAETRDNVALREQCFAMPQPMQQPYGYYDQYQCLPTDTSMTATPTMDVMGPMSNTMWSTMSPTMCLPPNPFDDSPIGTPRA